MHVCQNIFHQKTPNLQEREMPTKTNTLEDHDDDDSDDELLEMHNYHVDFLPLLSLGA